MQFKLEQTVHFLTLILSQNIGRNIEIIPQEGSVGEKVIILDDYTIIDSMQDAFDLVLVSDENERIKYPSTWDVYIEPKAAKNRYWNILLSHDLGTTKLYCFSTY